MKQGSLTLFQYGALTFSFLYGGTLLTHGAYRAGEGAWAAGVLGCLLGILFLLLVGGFAERGRRQGPPSALLRVGLLLLILFLALLSIADFATFFSVSLKPALPPALGAMALFAITLYAAFRGEEAIGRFAELSLLLLIPLLLILFPGLSLGDWSGFSMPRIELSFLRSALGVAVSTFGDAIALGVLGWQVVGGANAAQPNASSDAAGDCAQTSEPSVFQSASSAAARDAFPRLAAHLPRRIGLRFALLGGAIPAALLFVLTVVGNQAKLGAGLLADAEYPVPFASSILHHQVLEPFFLLALTLLYTVKVMALVLCACRLLASFLPPAAAHVSHALIALAAYTFFLFLAFEPTLAAEARKSQTLFVILLLTELLLPLGGYISFFLQKRFDK